MLKQLRPVSAALVALIALAVTAPAALAAPAWSPVAHVAGVFDLGGPRSDGKLVVAGSGKLYLMDASGTLSPFAQGPGGYADDKGTEAYLAVSPGLTGAGCSFAPDDVYILRLHAPIGITKVDSTGKKSNFVNLPQFTGGALASIAFDTTGEFGNRLLVTGTKAGERIFDAIDCSAKVSTLNGALPVNEGGAVVAPKSFGAFGGMYIVPDELSGKIYAFGANGSAQLLIDPGLPKGGDIGVEDLGFVPAGFLRGGVLYLADRLTPGGKHPGSDSVMTLSSADLAGAGVQEGDLLAATEGGGELIAVRCATSCQSIPVITTATKTHGEGHLAFITTAPPPSPTPSPTSTPAPSTPDASTSSPPVLLLVEIVVVVVLIALLTVGVVRRR
jgi:hypothetical protein